MANTAKYVIEKAYVDAAKIPRGGVPTPAQYLDGVDRLNDIINLEQTQGLRLWLEAEVELTPVAGQVTYSLRPSGDLSMTRPLRVMQASFKDSSNNRRPLDIISRDEWSRLSNRTTRGTITQIFVEKLIDRLNVNVWNAPDTSAATGRVVLVIHQQASNPTTISDATGFPPEWVLFLRWSLAADLATGMPEAVIQRCAMNAAVAKNALDAWDSDETATYFQPNERWSQPSRFR